MSNVEGFFPPFPFFQTISSLSSHKSTKINVKLCNFSSLPLFQHSFLQSYRFHRCKITNIKRNPNRTITQCIELNGKNKVGRERMSKQNKNKTKNINNHNKLFQINLFEKYMCTCIFCLCLLVWSLQYWKKTAIYYLFVVWALHKCFSAFQ